VSHAAIEAAPGRDLVTVVQTSLGMKAKPAIIFDESGRIVGEYSADGHNRRHGCGTSLPVMRSDQSKNAA
jgi:hypothetical protein